ncbi:MAG: winged helix-turn-helix domain-containing protein [Pirellulaceae bacterium]|nr:winged helix-turn-helix domain-containing protein [Pirellulaceae bacterium]
MAKKKVGKSELGQAALGRRSAVKKFERQPQPQAPPDAHWTFLTNHAHVLVLLARNPLAVLREVALEVGITERAVQRIVADLERGGFIQKERVGRQNQYRIDPQRKLRHPIESHRAIGDLLELANQGRPNGN